MVSATGEWVRSVPDGPMMLGQSGYEVAVTGVAPGQPAFILWDTSVRPRDYELFGLRLRVSLSPVAYVTGVGSSAQQAGIGYARTGLTVPAQPALVGAGIYGQWVVGDLVSPVGFVTSDAFHLVVR